MKKLMVLVVLLAVALVSAPAIAENGESTTPPPPIDEASADNTETIPPKTPIDPPAPSPTPIPAAPPTEPTAQEASAPETPPTVEDPVSGSSGLTSNDIGSDLGEGRRGSTRDNIVEDEAADADDIEAEDIEDQVVGRAIDVDAEAREDRIADRILADLKDGKKDEDEDDDDEDDDEDDDNKDEVEQSQDQDADSGDVDQDADVINTGDNVNQCVGILQVANTGNAQNATGITQFDSESDEIELEDGSQITLTPQLVVDCRQIILQIVRGERPNESKISKAKLRKVIQPRSGAAQAARTGAGVLVPSRRSGITATPKVLSASSAGRPAGQPKTSARSLPRTGGSYATLLGLGTRTLLVGGGLLVRRLAR